MPRTIKRMMYGLLLLGLLAPQLVTRVHAAEKLNVLVIGNDANEGPLDAYTAVVARDTRIFNQVQAAIDEELMHEGFAVFDASAFDSFKNDHAKQPEYELITKAQSLRQPQIDAMVVFTVYAGARKLTYTTDLSARITGRILNVRNGQVIGTLEMLSPVGWKAPADCEGDCLLGALGENAEMIAGNLSGALGEKLEALASNLNSSERIVPAAAALSSTRTANGYTLVFSGFAPDELSIAEEYLVAFKGYRAQTHLAASATEAKYWYEMDGDTAHLDRNLRMMLDRVGAEGKIVFSPTENTFLIEKTLPGKTR